MSKYLWTSPIPSVGSEQSIDYEILNEGIMDSISITSSIVKTNTDGTKDRYIEFNNSSNNSYIIEISLEPDEVESFGLCEGGPLKPRLRALTESSRGLYNSEGAKSKFFTIAAHSTLETVFENCAVQNINDDSVKAFFRLAGGFRQNIENDDKTFLFTEEENYSASQFDVWALLPTEHFDNSTFSQNSFVLSILESNIHSITYDNNPYKLILLFSDLGSSENVENLTIL
jgi:hypothetical protein